MVEIIRGLPEVEHGLDIATAQLQGVLRGDDHVRVYGEVHRLAESKPAIIRTECDGASMSALGWLAMAVGKAINVEGNEINPGSLLRHLNRLPIDFAQGPKDVFLAAQGAVLALRNNGALREQLKQVADTQPVIDLASLPVGLRYSGCEYKEDGGEDQKETSLTIVTLDPVLYVPNLDHDRPRFGDEVRPEETMNPQVDHLNITHEQVRLTTVGDRLQAGWAVQACVSIFRPEEATNFLTHLEAFGTSLDAYAHEAMRS